MSNRPTLHTTEEAAEILRVRPSWLERQAAARRIPFTMLGGYRFTDEHLSQIVRLFEQEPSAPLRSERQRPTRSAAVPRASDLVSPLRPRPRTDVLRSRPTAA
ncbi:MAG TPA: helix-turn-helix domain-containing protein [Actinocatenispora sp.]